MNLGLGPKVAGPGISEGHQRDCGWNIWKVTAIGKRKLCSVKVLVAKWKDVGKNKGHCVSDDVGMYRPGKARQQE